MAGARRYENLTAWKRAHELYLVIWAATEAGPSARDLKFRDQIRDASESIEQNVVEGFGRFSAGQCAHFLDIARASALETKILLRTGLDVGYWNAEQHDQLDLLVTRTVRAIAKLQSNLRSRTASANVHSRNAQNVSSLPNTPNDPSDPDVL